MKKYRVKLITITDKEVIKLPDDAIVIDAVSSRALEPFRRGSNRFRKVIRRWELFYLEPLIKEVK